MGKHVRLLVERDEFIGEAAVLQAVVQVEFARLQALADLAVQPELVAVSVESRRLALRVKRQQMGTQPLGQRGRRTLGERMLRQALLFRERAFRPSECREPGVGRVDAGKIERPVERAQMAVDAACEPIYHLPAQCQLARRLHTHALTSALQCILGHDLVRALAHIAEGRGVVDRVVDIEQQQASDLRRFLLTSYLLCNKLLVCQRLALVFELLHVIAQGVDEVVGELPVALPSVAKQVQVGLRRLEAGAGRRRCKSSPGSRSRADSAARSRAWAAAFWRSGTAVPA